MRRALAIALTTSLTLPASAASGAEPFKHDELAQTPVIDKSLIAHQRARKARLDRDRAAGRRAAAPVAMPAHLAAIAACESGGDPHAIGGGGLYRGAFQMTYAAWQSVGGSG